jgi:hypothetical protein
LYRSSMLKVYSNSLPSTGHLHRQTRFFHAARPIDFTTRYRPPGFGPPPGSDGAGLAALVHRLLAELRESDGEPGLGNLLVDFSPTMAIFRLVSSLNGVSSHGLRQESQTLRAHYLAGQATVVGAVLRGVGRRPVPHRRTSVDRATQHAHLGRSTPGCLHHQLESRHNGGHMVAALLSAANGPVTRPSQSLPLPPATVSASSVRAAREGHPESEICRGCSWGRRQVCGASVVVWTAWPPGGGDEGRPGRDRHRRGRWQHQDV